MLPSTPHFNSLATALLKLPALDVSGPSRAKIAQVLAAAAEGSTAEGEAVGGSAADGEAGQVGGEAAMGGYALREVAMGGAAESQALKREHRRRDELAGMDSAAAGFPADPVASVVGAVGAEGVAAVEASECEPASSSTSSPALRHSPHQRMQHASRLVAACLSEHFDAWGDLQPGVLGLGRDARD